MTGFCFGKLPGRDVSFEQLVNLCVGSSLCLWVEEEYRNQEQEGETPEEETDLDVPACTLI